MLSIVLDYVIRLCGAALKVEDVQPGLDGVLDLEDLLRDDAEHLGVHNNSNNNSNSNST